MLDLHKLTPVEYVGGVHFKREDKFMPDTNEFVNGSKLRQCLFLIGQAHAHGKTGVVSGAVSGSPQHPMATYCAQQYGMDSIIYTGSTKTDQYPYLKLAQDMGAELISTNIGYAKALNAKCLNRSIKEKRLYHLQTNITLSEKINMPDEIAAFHDIGAAQVQNVPKNVDTIYIPAGSCNSATSVLHGLAKYKIDWVTKVVLFGIGSFGSSDPKYIKKRLEFMALHNNIDYGSVFNFSEFEISDSPIEVMRYDINGSGYAKYADLMPAEYCGIKFHPRYEGKVWNYIRDNGDIGLSPNVMFWIVGSEIGT